MAHVAPMSAKLRLGTLLRSERKRSDRFLCMCVCVIVHEYT
jgi:hypothetical protein